MDKQRVRERIVEIGIVPVVRAASPREARMAADAVCEGGIPIVEITMTVPGAVDVIRELTKSGSSDVLVGAGTVLNAEAARRCLDAGAQFLVSPGLNLEVVKLAGTEGKLMMAGAERRFPVRIKLAVPIGGSGKRDQSDARLAGRQLRRRWVVNDPGRVSRHRQ